jgi:hypothetical protein
MSGSLPVLPVVFLVDVDDTLLENDRIQNDLRERLEREFGADSRDRYREIIEALFEEQGYRDYLGALQRYRIEVDDKLRILAATKKAWGDRVTTVFPRQGKFANDPEALAAYPPGDVTVERIGDLLSCGLSNLRPTSADSSL